MILLFGQLPQRAVASRQMPTHGLVGSVADMTPPLIPPTEFGGMGGPVYIRRQEIAFDLPEHDEDVILALGALLSLESNNHE